jgi:SAM-dependent methyltransferase
MTVDYTEVTELAGTEITAEQLERMVHRYHWAAGYCRGKDVVEVACGSGQGLGLLGAVAKSLEAGDYSKEVLAIPRAHYRDRFPLREFDAQSLPYRDASKDVIVLFEAIYYVADASRFVAECKRVLRPGGQVLVATANKDLADFNPSPLSYEYYGVADLGALFRTAGFVSEEYGYLPVGAVSWRQKVLRPIKQLVVALGLMPKTMKGKKLLKRLVFGSLVPMPAELPTPTGAFEPPTPLAAGVPDRVHKVLYCRATLSV